MELSMNLEPEAPAPPELEAERAPSPDLTFTNLARLPIDVVVAILEHFRPATNEHWLGSAHDSKRQSLKACARVNSEWRVLAQRELFRLVTITTAYAWGVPPSPHFASLVRLFEALENNHALGNLVINLHLSIAADQGDISALLRRLLWRCPNILTVSTIAILNLKWLEVLENITSLYLAPRSTLIGDEDVALPLASIRHLTFATSLNFAGAAQSPTNFLQSFPLVDNVALQTGYFPGPLTARDYTSLVTPFLATLRRLTLGAERLEPGDPPAEQARSAQLLLWHALLPTCTSLEQLDLPYHPCDDTRGLLACLPPVSSPPTFDAPLLVQIDVYPPLFIRVDHFRSRTHTLDALLRDVLAQSPPTWRVTGVRLWGSSAVGYYTVGSAEEAGRLGAVSPRTAAAYVARGVALEYGWERRSFRGEFRTVFGGTGY